MSTIVTPLQDCLSQLQAQAPESEEPPSQIQDRVTALKRYEEARDSYSMSEEDVTSAQAVCKEILAIRTYAGPKGYEVS
jgi:hypothetical protein